MEDHLVSEETQAKLQAMKMMVRWLLGMRNNENNVAVSTLRLLSTMLTHDGDLMEKGQIWWEIFLITIFLSTVKLINFVNLGPGGSVK